MLAAYPTVSNLTLFGCVTGVLWVVGDTPHAWVIWITAIPLSLAVAHMVHTLVERPSQRLSSKFLLRDEE